MKADAILHRTTEFIRPSVAERRIELVEQIAVCRMDLHPVKAGFLDAFGCFLEVQHNLFNFCPLQFVWNIAAAARMQNRRRADSDRTGYFLCSRTAGMIDLHHTLAAVLVE